MSMSVCVNRDCTVLFRNPSRFHLSSLIFSRSVRFNDTTLTLGASAAPLPEPAAGAATAGPEAEPMLEISSLTSLPSRARAKRPGQYFSKAEKDKKKNSNKKTRKQDNKKTHVIVREKKKGKQEKRQGEEKRHGVSWINLDKEEQST